MSDFRLLPGIKVEYDKENDLFRFLNHFIGEPKKLTSRAFPSLLGENKWESIGKNIMERYRMTQKDKIDPFYTVRGEIAEMLAEEYLVGFYKEKLNIDIETKRWDKEKINYDNFPKNPRFGGMLDIAIVNPKEHHTVVEVKSKSIKDLDKVVANKGNREEVLQGVFLTYLSVKKKCLMVYIFFTPEQEDIIKDYMASQKAIGYAVDSKIFAKEIIKNNNWTYKKFKIVPFRYLVKDFKMEENLEKTYHLLSRFKKEESISARYFTDKEVAYLKNLAGVKEEITSLF